eukprot:759267-Amphidinium_carterae.1
MHDAGAPGIMVEPHLPVALAAVFTGQKDRTLWVCVADYRWQRPSQWRPDTRKMCISWTSSPCVWSKGPLVYPRSPQSSSDSRTRSFHKGG